MKWWIDYALSRRVRNFCSPDMVSLEGAAGFVKGGGRHWCWENFETVSRIKQWPEFFFVVTWSVATTPESTEAAFYFA